MANPTFYTIIDENGEIVYSHKTTDPNFVPGPNQRLVKDEVPEIDYRYYYLDRVLPVPDGQDYIEYRKVSNIDGMRSAMRTHRNDRLTESDWTQIPDNQLTEEQREMWRVYRQQLRDFPEQDGYPYINFPEKPE